MPTKAKPAALKRLHGSDQPRDEPVAHGDLAGTGSNACPKHLSSAQREIWEYTLAHAPRDVLKRIDRFVLEAWAVAVSLHQSAVEHVNALGDDIMVVTPNGHLIQSPYMAVLNRQALIIRVMASEFGFTPVARARLGSGGHTKVGESLVKPGAYAKGGRRERESIESYLERAAEISTQH